MDHIATLERAPEEVSALPPVPPPRQSSRFSVVAVLAAVAAAVLGISALGGVAATRTGAADLASNGAALAEGGTQPPSEAQPGAPGAGHTPGGDQAPPAAGGGQQAATTHEVRMAGLMFSPASLTVAVGDTVTWVNDDSASHTVTVTSGPEEFDSGLLAPGESFSHTFTMPGTYEYYCAVHPDMKASVLVEEAGAGAAPAPPPPGEGGEAAPEQPSAPAPPAGGGADCVPSTANGALMRHIEVAHLQASPGQQVQDLAAVDQYVKTHTVLLNDMFKPLFDGVATDAVATSLGALQRHVEAAHLQKSPGEQAADLADLDQYVKTHTVLVQDMMSPYLEPTVC